MAIALLFASAAPLDAQAVKDTRTEKAEPSPEDRRRLLLNAKSWGYLLQDISTSLLSPTTYDVLVLDAGTPAPGADLGKADIAKLRRKPDGSRRLLIAYLNIGEAEDYRYYWKAAWTKRPPEWLGTANCRWKGDHRVRFWHSDWQAIVFGTTHSYMGRILTLGYDGVWLDRVDIHNAFAAERASARADMIDFVVRLSGWAKAQQPGFLVLPQNGEELYASPAYVAAVDGAGKEDFLFGDHGNGRPNDADRIARSLAHIRPLLDAGRPVFAVEYLKDAALVDDARARLQAVGFKPYFGPRSLSRLGPVDSGHAEDRDTEAVRGLTPERC